MKFSLPKIVTIGTLVVTFFVAQIVSAKVIDLKPTGYVNDFANVLTGEQVATLNNELALFTASTSNEITVVTIPSLEGDYIEHYAVELFKAWGIGTKEHDNGILLLIAVNDHKMRIEVGYGLEGAVTDLVSGQIIQNDLVPAFKQNDFYGGIRKAVSHLMDASKGEYVGEKISSASGKGTGLSFESYFIAFIVLIQVVGALLARSKSWWAGGVIGAFLGAAFGLYTGASIIVSLVIASCFGLLGSAFDYVVSRGRGFGPGVGGTGGFGGFRSSSGSGFGGFSGGRSGGGGSSGSW